MGNKSSVSCVSLDDIFEGWENIPNDPRRISIFMIECGVKYIQRTRPNKCKNKSFIEIIAMKQTNDIIISLRPLYNDFILRKHLKTEDNIDLI